MRAREATIGVLFVMSVGLGWAVGNGSRWFRIVEPEVRPLAQTKGTKGGAADAHILLAELESESKSALHIEGSLDQLSEDQLRELVGGLSPRFWKQSSEAGLVTSYYCRRILSKGESDHLRAAIEFVRGRNADNQEHGLLRAAIGGIFDRALPPAASVAALLEEIDEGSFLTIAEVYLAFSRESTLPDLTRVSQELIATQRDLKPSPELSEKLKTLVDREWVAKGAAGLESQLTGAKDIPANALRAGLARLAALNPSRAKSILSALASQSPQLSGELALASRISFKDLPAICSAIPRSGREAFYESIASGLRTTSPLTLRRLYAELPVAEVPESSLAKLVAQGLGSSPAEVARWLAPLKEKGIEMMDRFSLQDWSDPDVAANYLAARLPLGNFDENGSKILGCMASIAEHDLSRAESALQHLPEALRKKAEERIYSASLAKLALNDTAGLLSALSAAPPRTQVPALKSIAATAAKTTQVDVLKITENLPVDQKRVFVNELLTSIEPSDFSAIPKKICQALADDILKEPYNPDALDGIANLAKATVKTDPMKAVEYLNWIPEGADRDSKIGPIVEAWAEADPGAACDWVESLAAGPARDKAISSIVRSAPSELETVLDSVPAIQDRTVRLAALRTLQEAWEPADADRFSQALSSSKVDAMDRSEIASKK